MDKKVDRTFAEKFLNSVDTPLLELRNRFELNTIAMAI